MSKWIAFCFDSPNNILANLRCLFSPFTAWFSGSVTVLQALPFALSHGSQNQSNIEFRKKEIKETRAVGSR
jgi:hypothetical protein